MSGRTKASSMRWAASLGLAGQPRGCAYSASLGSIANFGLRAQIGWSAKCRSGGGLEGVEAAIHASWVSLRNKDWINCLATSQLLLDVQTTHPQIGTPQLLAARPAR